ncbi:MAG TPA: tetratricopeptide repeat protein [Pyrinomonadaceae bacterium]|nr:tetratricopeptide repeat protein [Pyrinomonadaceae bacterium]
MIKMLVLSVAVVLSTLCASSVTAQTRLHKDFASSKDTYSESKRLYNEGVAYALAGLYSQAAQIFEQAVRLDPKFADAHFALGHAYYDMRRWQNAIDSFKRAVELNPHDLEAQDRLEESREMLARETGKKVTPAPTRSAAPAPIQGATPAKSEPLRQPVAEKIALNAKPDTPSVTTTGDPKSEVKESPKSEANENSTKESSSARTNAAANDLALTKLYRVGPGDVLDIRINDTQAPQSTLFTITPAGLLEHPLLAEPLHVGGLSVEEIGSNLEGDLKRRALAESPRVSVAVRDYASHTILVSGLVKDSGTKILRREAIPLYVVVADAQPLPEAARVTVVRSEANEAYDIDLAQPAEMNLLVRPGDVITLLANVTQFLYIGGEVKSPGEKTYRRGLTLTQALIAAGGVTPKAKEARLGRDDGRGFLTVTRIKLKDIESGKVPDPQVRPGDRITIDK